MSVSPIPACPTPCSTSAEPTPEMSHTHRHGPPAIWNLTWTSLPFPTARMGTTPMVPSLTEGSATPSEPLMTASGILSSVSLLPATASIDGSVWSAPSAATTFVTSTVMLTSSKPETTLAAPSSSPAFHQTSDTGDPLLKVVITVSIIAVLAFVALFMLTLKKQSPERYESVVAYCPFHLIWSYVLLILAAIHLRQPHNPDRQNRSQAPPDEKRGPLSQSPSIEQSIGQSTTHTTIRFSEDTMNAPDRHRSDDMMDTRGRSRTERIQGLGIDLANPSPAEQPGFGRKLLRSISRSGNKYPARMSVLSDHKSARGSDSSMTWQIPSPFSDEARTPPQLYHSPHFNIRISDFSMASSNSDMSTEDLSTYHSNLARLKAERAERVKQMGLSSNDSLEVRQIDPRRSGARKSFVLSPGKKFRAYLGANPASPDGGVSRFHEQKSKFGQQASDKRMGVDALKTWWDKLGSEHD